jgi:hypothetical protein
MPQQLIYTSAQRGLVAGRSGHCTVARSAAMREALMLQLEKLSYYQHLSLTGGQERQIYSCRVLDIRGSRFHVLSRIQDAGLDFTNRTNFLAHHLVFIPEEIRQFMSPPVILRSWSGWVKTWNQEPQMLENEDWSGLANISGVVSVPAQTWQQVTGDAVNGYGLLDSRAGIAFRVDNLSEDQILALFAESLELLELRDPRRDFRVTCWQYTFTTSMQEQDNPADFRWRCLHSDNPVSNRSAGPDCRQLTEVRAQRVTNEEKMFAQSGRQPPRFVTQPKNVRVTEGEPARFRALAEGVPSPSYQWYSVDQAGNGQIIANGTAAELVLPNPPFGVSRYVVRASNSQGEVTSEVVKLESEKKLRISQPQPDEVKRVVPKTTAPSYVRSADDIEKQRRRIEVEKAQEQFQKKLRRNKIMAICGVVGGLVVMGVVVGVFLSKHSKPGSISAITGSSNAITASNITSSVPTPNDAATSNPTTSSPKTMEDQKVKPSPETKSEHTSKLPPPTGFDLPAGWTKVAVGTVSNTYTGFESQRFELSGNALGFDERGDNSFFVYSTNITNEFQATLILNQQIPIPLGGACGVMARESEKANAAFLFIGYSPSKIIEYRRDGKGHFDSKDIPQDRQFKQLYFRIKVVGKNIVSQFASDPNNWQTGSLSNSVPEKGLMMAGMAVSSGSLTSKVVAKFGGVSGN